VEDLTSAYNQFRFGGRCDVAPRMIRLLDRLESLPLAYARGSVTIAAFEPRP